MRAARKRQVLAELFGAEVARLLRALATLADAHRVARDLPLASLRDALVEVTACLPVYRTYVDERGPSAADAARLDQAFTEARDRATADPVLPRALDFLEQVLHLRTPPELADRRGDSRGVPTGWSSCPCLAPCSARCSARSTTSRS